VKPGDLVVIKIRRPSILPLADSVWLMGDHPSRGLPPVDVKAWISSIWLLIVVIEDYGLITDGTCYGWRSVNGLTYP
jgi:hypothetical protein